MMRFALMLAVGCAKVSDVEPQHAIVCPGDPVTVRWTSSGTTTVTIDPPVAGVPNGETSADHITLTPTAAKTTVAIHASRLFGHADGETELDVDPGELVTGSAADPSATCTNNTMTTTAHLSPASFAADVLVGMIAVEGSETRTFTITHAGLTATIAPQHPSKQFAGKPVRGDWQISTTLASCEPANIPSNLAFRAFTRCTP